MDLLIKSLLIFLSFFPIQFIHAKSLDGVARNSLACKMTSLNKANLAVSFLNSLAFALPITRPRLQLTNKYRGGDVFRKKEYFPKEEILSSQRQPCDSDWTDRF